MGLLDRVAGQCEMRLLAAPWAPGLTIAFARWRGSQPILSSLATGTGPDPESAMRRALGEIAENLSLSPEAWPAPVVVCDPADGRRLCDDARARPQAGDDNLGSEGCAAGETATGARLAALCERAERAALARWWAGDLAARRLVVPEAARRYRGTARQRRDLLFALPFLPGLTICLAVSDDGAGGRLALGSAAALTPEDAADAALREAMQAEVAWLAPQTHPDVAQRDHAHRGLIQRLPQLLAAAPTTPAPGGGTLDTLLTELRQQGIAHGFADLTLVDPGIPVWRFVCPDWPRARPLFDIPAPGANDAGLTHRAAG